MRRIGLKSIFVILLTIPLTITAILLYFYFTISRPPGAPAYETRQLKLETGIYGYGTESYELLYRPTDVAFDSEGNVYVADTGHARIVVFNSSGKLIRKIGTKGFSKGEFAQPVGVTVSETGDVYVADKGLNKIVIFSSIGRFINEFKVIMPLKPYVAKDNLYVATSGHVMVYDLTGKQIAKWGAKGQLKGDFDSPTGIAVGADGTVYVSDTFNLRLQAFTSKGELLWVKGAPAKDIKAQDRLFGLPCGIAMDEKERLFLIDAFESNIKVLNTKGDQITVIGKKGAAEGELNLPAGIAYYKDGSFAVADKFNDRIQILKLTVD